MSTGSSGTYATPLRLELTASRVLPACLLAVHLLVAATVLLLPLDGAVRWLLVPAIAASAVHGRRRDAVVPAGGKTVLSWLQGADCLLVGPDGTQQSARLLPRAFVQPWLVVLHLQMAGRMARPLVIVPDMLEACQFRRLRVRLTLELDRSAGSS